MCVYGTSIFFLFVFSSLFQSTLEPNLPATMATYSNICTALDILTFLLSTLPRSTLLSGFQSLHRGFNNCMVCGNTKVGGGLYLEYHRHMYVYAYIPTYVRMYIRTCIYMYMYVYTYIHVQYYSTCVHVSIYVHTYVHTYVYIHTVHTCAYIHIYPKTGCASVHPAPNPSDGHVPHGARHGSPVLKTGRTGTSLLQRCPGYQRGPLCL